MTVGTERIRYEALGVEMVGHLALPNLPGGPRPGVLLMHEGGGQDDNVRRRADELAGHGFVAFALDYLGGGTQHPLPEAQARLAELFADLSATRALALAGYRLLTERPEVDAERVAAAGFCFGGVMALELARAGVPLRAAVGFHPAFAAAQPGSADIRASVLMMCGADDPIVTADDRRRFEDEMRDAGVADWRLEVYGGAGHSFTNPDIAGRGLPAGFAYDERADRRSWRALLDLLAESFG